MKLEGRRALTHLPSCIQADSRGAAQLLESIIFIIDSVLPLIRKLSETVVEELEQDLMQMIVRHPFFVVVHACIKYGFLLLDILLHQSPDLTAYLM